MKKSNDGESPDEETSTESGSHQRRAPKYYSNDIRLEPTWKTNKVLELFISALHVNFFQLALYRILD